MPSRIWVPPSAREFPPEVEAILAATDDPAEARRLALALEDAGVSVDVEPGRRTPESVAILFPRDWVRVDTEHGKVVCAVTNDEAIERLILDNALDYENAGVVIDAEHPILNGLCPALHVRLRQFQTFTPLEYPACPFPAPWGDWRSEAAERGLGLAVMQDDGQAAWFATGPMSSTSISVAGGQRSAKVSRNERCPCGSGLKHKHCCGR